MNFDAETGCPISHEQQPDILHDLILIRRVEIDSPGKLQEVHQRDIDSALTRLKEYRNLVISPASTDDARQRAIDDGAALMGALEDMLFCRVEKITRIVCDTHSSGQTDTGPMLPREQQLFDDVSQAIVKYLSDCGFTPTRDGMRLSMATVAGVHG